MDKIERIGLLIIFVGVAFWLLLIADYEVMQILPFHLAFVIPGFVLRRYKWFSSILNRGG
ncbi:MAG: hypothetical protein SVM80_03555 [Halobacteriota archaeon]|nr:hypothetical protein [Halobacteriota archaeon]